MASTGQEFQQHEVGSTTLERSKRSRQEQSRNAVISGSKTLEQNFFIPKDTARQFSFTFKG